MFLIEISYKKQSYDAKAHRVHADLADVHADVTLQTAQLYAIDGVTMAEAKRIAEECLCDSVTEAYSITASESLEKLVITQHPKAFVVDVWFKPGVTDTVGDTVCRTIKTIGILKTVSVRTGDRYIVPGNLKPAVVRTITEQLANNIIQHYTIRKPR